jgi:hypothetical protein
MGVLMMMPSISSNRILHPQHGYPNEPAAGLRRYKGSTAPFETHDKGKPLSTHDGIRKRRGGEL